MTKLEQAEVKPIENDINQDNVNENSINEENAEALEVFESRWRYAVFPAMIAFVILASFGFYLIYGMLQHMESMSKDIHRMTSLMEVTVPVISKDISDLNETISMSMPSIQSDVREMSQSTQSMTTSISELNKTISITMPGIQSNVSDMSESTHSMAASTKHLEKSTYELNRSISRPMNFMNNMMPFNIDPPPPLRFIE